MCNAKAHQLKVYFLISQHMETNLLASQIHDNSMLHHDSVICEKCHNTILQESLLICIICEQTVAKKCLVGKHKYASLKQTMPQIANISK